MDKDKVSNTTARICLMLQQRNFTEAETRALIKCLEALLEHQIKKHVEKQNET